MNSASTTITMSINGREVSGNAEPRTHLADFLREELLLTGTHLGCEQGVCGACTLMVDGRQVRACLTLAVSCEKAEIETVEGYNGDPLMAEIRDAFKRHHGLQCGYCTPGMLAAVYDLIRRHPKADEDIIRRQLSGNLCRCTGYAGIVEAVKDVLAGNTPEATVTPGPRAFIPIAEAKPATGGEESGEVVRLETGSYLSDLPSRAKLSEGIELIRSLDLDVSPDAIWQILKDPQKVVRCIPGASLTNQTDHNLIHGVCKVAVGPMAATFRGSAEVSTNDETLSGNVIGKGKDRLSRSILEGCLDYSVSANDNGGSSINLNMLYRLSGPLSQFGRPAIVEEIADQLLQKIGVSLVEAATGKTTASNSHNSVGGISILLKSLLNILKKRFDRKL